VNRLQELIGGKLAEGKSYRRIGEECGIDHVSVSNYHRKGKIPQHGKNLALLAKYFRTPIDELLEEVKPSGPPHYPASPEHMLLEQEVADLSETEQLEVIVILRKWKKDRAQNSELEQ